MVNTFLTLLINEDYLPGALVLAQSLRALQTTASISILISNVSPESTDLLQDVYDDVISIEPISNLQNQTELNLLQRPDLFNTFTKILIWKQTQYSKIVYLDCDILPLKNVDELFDLDVEIAASPDSGWPDIFNSGVIVTKPNLSTYNKLIQHSTENNCSFDGADQGLFNQFFTNWVRLPFIYNVTPSAGYQYVPAFKKYRDEIKVLHFIGFNKPWKTRSAHEFALGYNGSTYEILYDLHSQWWSVFDKYYFGDLAAQIFANTTFLAKGEAYNLADSKIPNAWEVEEDSDISGEPETIQRFTVPPLFPWEKRGDLIEPTRVFNNDFDFASGFKNSSNSTQLTQDKRIVPETFEPVTSSNDMASIISNRKIKSHYALSNSENNNWDPQASLEKISKISAGLVRKPNDKESGAKEK